MTSKKPVDLEGVPELVVLFSDVSDESRDLIVSHAKSAWLSKSRSDFLYWQQCAELIKNEVEKAMGPTWHVIVGEHFGAFVAHEVGRCFYASIGQMKLLVFKHG